MRKTEETEFMQKKWTVTGCVLWIAGLAAAITGLNLTGETGTWLTVIGNIIFLIGLGITGALWFQKKKADSQSAQAEEKQRT